jgi:HK97 gp10 family phage protein
MGNKLTVDVVVAVNNTDKVLEEITHLVSQAISEVADELVNEAQALAPVRTGALRESIHKEPIDELNVAVGSELVYAPFIEYGTSRMSAQSYLTPASISAREKLKQKLGGS